MKCVEKEDLQHKCTAAFNLYESAVKDLGLPFDPTTKMITPRSSKESQPPKRPVLDPNTGLLVERYLHFSLLLRDYQKASSALSKHLSAHRC